MLVLKNVGSNKSIGVIKRVFDLGYDILQKELNKLDIDCDESFNLCVLYYNEFYHSEYNDKNISEYEAMVKFKNNNEVSIEEWLKRIQLMFQICQYYEYTLSFDIENMKICLFNDSKKYYNPSQFQYNYKTIEEFALGWIITCIQTNNKLTVWTNEDLNRLKSIGGLPISKDKNQIQDFFNFEFFVTDEEIKKGLYIRRYEISDQSIDDCEMDTNDYLIATFKTLDNISFNIFTTHNLYNVYIVKIITYEDGTCDTEEMYNITSDSLKWNTKQDIINYFLGMNY
jgi:hypothetical protein